MSSFVYLCVFLPKMRLEGRGRMTLEYRLLVYFPKLFSIELSNIDFLANLISPSLILVQNSSLKISSNFFPRVLKSFIGLYGFLNFKGNLKILKTASSSPVATLLRFKQLRYLFLMGMFYLGK